MSATLVIRGLRLAVGSQFRLVVAHREVPLTVSTVTGVVDRGVPGSQVVVVDAPQDVVEDVKRLKTVTVKVDGKVVDGAVVVDVVNDQVVVDVKRLPVSGVAAPTGSRRLGV
jgi:hypothetical protein